MSEKVWHLNLETREMVIEDFISVNGKPVVSATLNFKDCPDILVSLVVKAVRPINLMIPTLEVTTNMDKAIEECP